MRRLKSLDFYSATFGIHSMGRKETFTYSLGVYTYMTWMTEKRHRHSLKPLQHFGECGLHHFSTRSLLSAASTVAFSTGVIIKVLGGRTGSVHAVFSVLLETFISINVLFILKKQKFTKEKPQATKRQLNCFPGYN